MLLKNNSRQESILHIRRSMRRGDMDSVYHLLSQSSFPNVEKICHRYELELKRFQEEEVDTELWCLDQLQDFKEILDWPDFRQNQEKITGELDKRLLFRLVNSLELEKALSLCEVLGDSSILMQARYKIFENLFYEGKIEPEIWELVRHSTQYQLWELANAPELNSSVFFQYLENIEKWLKGLFV